MKIVLLLNSVDRLFCTYAFNTYKLNGPGICVLYACMNGHSTLLHYIAPGHSLSSRLNIDYSCISKYFLTNQLKNNNKTIHKNAHDFGP